MVKDQSIAMTVRKACAAVKDHIIFDNLSFDLPAGQWSCLLGASGIGKTTLLRLLAGAKPRNGLEASAEMTQNFYSLAFMTQQDGLLPWLSALDNIRIGDILRGKAKSSSLERARILLEKIGLSGRDQALPATFSGGERQRISLARTLFEECSIIFMDEPFSALDNFTRQHIQNLACDLLHGKTVLHVTHDPFEAFRLSHHIFILEGSPPILKTHPVPPDLPPRKLYQKQSLQWQAEWMEKTDALF